MTIYGGDEVYVNVTKSNADFKLSTIEFKQISRSVTINCLNGNECNNNYINASYIYQYINISCNGLNSNCNNNTIYSSNDMLTFSKIANINMECSLCQNNDIYTINGERDVSLHCNNNMNACTSSQIWFGGKNLKDFWINVVWNDIDKKWIYGMSNFIL